MPGSVVSARSATPMMGVMPTTPSTPPDEAATTGKVLSFGAMIGPSIVFPSAYAGGSVSPTLTLAIFFCGVVVFILLHYREFASVGLHVATVASLLLFGIMLLGVAETINPILPLYITSVCLITPHTYAWKPKIRAWMTGINPRDDTPQTTSQVGRMSESEWNSNEERGRRSSYDYPYQSTDPRFGHMGPSSHYSGESGSTGTTISLGNVVNATRDYMVSRFIVGNAYDGDQGAHSYEAARHMEEGQARSSIDRTAASDEAVPSDIVMSTS